MDLKSVFRQNDKIVYREEDDGAFLFDPDTGDLRYMNPSGKETFSLLTEDWNIGQIVERMLELYPGIDPLQIHRDVESFIKDLVEGRFILPVEAP